jgi:hypothetical protein
MSAMPFWRVAALEIATWLLEDVWSIPIHGLKLSADCGGMLAFFHHFVFPAAALAGAALAFKDRRLPLSRPAGQRVDDCELGRRRRLHSRGHDVRF